MGSEKNPHCLKVPVIDFSVQPLKPETPEWDSVRAQVRRALEEFGCFEAVFDKIPLDMRRDAIFEALKELFDLPLQTKQQRVSDKLFQGYLGQIPTVPLFESLGIDGANIHRKAESFTNIMWPQGNPGFCKTIQSYSEQLSEMDQMIRRMILESLEVEKYLEEHLGSTDYLLRVMKYEAPKTAETKVGLEVHTDKNIVTILNQNQVDGLEVQTKDGQWISVNPSVPGSFVVLIGETFSAWSNGRLHAPSHRVTMTGNEARYSAGLFSIPKAGYIVKTPEELVDQQHPLLFKPFEYFDFLGFFRTEAGRRAGSAALKIYCGVKY